MEAKRLARRLCHAALCTVIAVHEHRMEDFIRHRPIQRDGVVVGLLNRRTVISAPYCSRKRCAPHLPLLHLTAEADPVPVGHEGGKDGPVRPDAHTNALRPKRILRHSLRHSQRSFQ